MVCRFLGDESRRRLITVDNVDTFFITIESTQTLLVDIEKVRFAVEQVRLAEVEDAGQGQREADGDDEERPSMSTNIFTTPKS